MGLRLLLLCYFTRLTLSDDLGSLTGLSAAISDCVKTRCADEGLTSCLSFCQRLQSTRSAEDEKLEVAESEASENSLDDHFSRPNLVRKLFGLRRVRRDIADAGEETPEQELPTTRRPKRRPRTLTPARRPQGLMPTFTYRPKLETLGPLILPQSERLQDLAGIVIPIVIPPGLGAQRLRQPDEEKPARDLGRPSSEDQDKYKERPPGKDWVATPLAGQRRSRLLVPILYLTPAGPGHFLLQPAGRTVGLAAITAGGAAAAVAYTGYKFVKKRRANKRNRKFGKSLNGASSWDDFSSDPNVQFAARGRSLAVGRLSASVESDNGLLTVKQASKKPKGRQWGKGRKSNGKKPTKKVKPTKKGSKPGKGGKKKNKPSGQGEKVSNQQTSLGKQNELGVPLDGDTSAVPTAAILTFTREESSPTAEILTHAEESTTMSTTEADATTREQSSEQSRSLGETAESITTAEPSSESLDQTAESTTTTESSSESSEATTTESSGEEDAKPKSLHQHLHHSLHRKLKDRSSQADESHERLARQLRAKRSVSPDKGDWQYLSNKMGAERSGNERYKVMTAKNGQKIRKIKKKSGATSRTKFDGKHSKRVLITGRKKSAKNYVHRYGSTTRHRFDSTARYRHVSTVGYRHESAQKHVQHAQKFINKARSKFSTHTKKKHLKYSQKSKMRTQKRTGKSQPESGVKHSNDPKQRRRKSMKHAARKSLNNRRSKKQSRGRHRTSNRRHRSRSHRQHKRRRQSRRQHGPVKKVSASAS